MPRVSPEEKKDWRGIWVVGEVDGDALAPVTKQMLGATMALRESTGEDVELVLMGQDLLKAAEEGAKYGVARVYVADDEALEPYRTLTHAGVLTRLADQRKPSIMLLAATPEGRDLAPRVAARLGTGLTAHALDFKVDEEGRFVQACPGFSGNAMVDICCPEHRPQMVTVRPGAFTLADAPVEGATAEIVDVSGFVKDIEDPLTVLLRDVDPRAAQVDLPEARVIVAGGRGMKTKENFELLYELAELLGGSVAATRAACDEGWAPVYCQIGQTGITVQPKYYLAFGISGAVQHVAGVRGAEVIVAVNTDGRAPIFATADYGFVADAPAVARRLVADLKAKKEAAGQ
jgi:electron transfer flavoprotein alpha subunit